MADPLVLITGAGGFMGSHLAEAAVSAGYRVRAFVRYNSANRRGWMDHSTFQNEIEVVVGDIRDFDSVNSAVHGCEMVFHLAALIGIPYSYVSPMAYIRTNIEGTYNILEASRHSGIRKVLITSTSETYGSAQYVPMDELHPAVGQSPYAATKIGADQIALSYWRSFGLPVSVVRPFNTYGPRQSARAIIPTIISQIAAGNRTIQVGKLSPTRDFTYVLDTVAGFLAIALSDTCVGTATNIGTNSEISIAELIRVISSLMEVTVDVTEDENRIRPTGSEVERLRCNNSRICDLTGWTPKWSFAAGLSETIDWVISNQDCFKPKLYTI